MSDAKMREAQEMARQLIRDSIVEDALSRFIAQIIEVAAKHKPPAPSPDMSDPTVVHLNMLRGTIAKPSVEQIIHVYGIDALCKALAPNVVREAESAPLTDYDRKVEQKNKDFPNVF